MFVLAFNNFWGRLECFPFKPKSAPFASPAKSNSYKKLLASIKNNPIHIPNLLPLMSNWPMGVSPNLEKLVLVMDEKIDSLFPDRIKAEKLKSCDFALFTSAWWPRAGFEELRTLSFLSLWLFVWDDEIDETTGSLSNNFESAQTYRQETIKYVTQCLQLGQEHEKRCQPANFIIRSFDVIGEALCKAYSREQRETFLKEIAFFIQMSEVEQRHNLKGYSVKTPEEYWKVRLGTSAVNVTSAVNEFSSKTIIPCSIMTHPDMKLILYECNINISTINDILSLKKEIAKGATNSLIPILSIGLRSPQLAVDTAVASVQESMNNFDMAASRLLANISDSSPYKDDVYEFIQDCRYNCTGNLYWSLHTKRYWKDGVPWDANGRITFTL